MINQNINIELEDMIDKTFNINLEALYEYTNGNDAEYGYSFDCWVADDSEDDWVFGYRLTNEENYGYVCHYSDMEGAMCKLIDIRHLLDNHGNPIKAAIVYNLDARHDDGNLFSEPFILSEEEFWVVSR